MARSVTKEIKLTLGERVKELREYLKLNQSELARKVGISQPTLWYIENQKHKSPTVQIVKKMAEALGVSIDYLVTGRK